MEISHLVVARVLGQKALGLDYVLPHATIYLVEAANIVYRPV